MRLAGYSSNVERIISRRFTLESNPASTENPLSSKKLSSRSAAPSLPNPTIQHFLRAVPSAGQTPHTDASTFFKASTSYPLETPGAQPAKLKSRRTRESLHPRKALISADVILLFFQPERNWNTWISRRLVGSGIFFI